MGEHVPVGEHLETGERGGPGECVDDLWPLPTPCSIRVSHLVAPELYPFIIIGALVSKMFL